MSSTVFLHTYTPNMVALYNYNFVFSCLNKCNLAQLKFIQNTTIKIFFWFISSTMSPFCTQVPPLSLHHQT